MFNVSKLVGVFALGMMVALAGCAGEEAEEAAGTEHHEGDGHDHDHGEEGHTHEAGDEGHTAAPSPELKPLVATAGAPATFVGVSKARAAAPAGEDVVVIGRLKDFVEGKAAFTMVDGSIKSCAEMEDDHCPTPWDYCCVSPSKLSKNMATVKLVGADGEMLEGNLQGVNSIDNLSTVVVTGKAQKDDAGNLTIAATKVYLK